MLKNDRFLIGLLIVILGGAIKAFDEFLEIEEEEEKEENKKAIEQPKKGRGRPKLLKTMIILGIVFISIVSIAYAVQNVDFTNICFTGKLIRENINGTFNYDFIVHHCNYLNFTG